MSSPSAELSKKIVAKLIDAKLIVDADVTELTVGLAEGKLRPEDWKLSVEKGMDAAEAKSK